ncbi:hypothetical protein [Planctomycetes bacterium K23_9]|uniref:Thiamine transporter membrane protein n=1 Tax=Stieleria marina TaxID=1930275 RepID=A0A517NSE5_9BACT|nr:thiamine transporter membrane protein [Planctomycetes bacterium K23_9]
MSLLLTIQLMVVAVAIATVVGVVGAWAATTASESGSRLGRFVGGVFFLSMVICAACPMILHAAAWEATAGKFGWLPLTQVGASQTGSPYGGLGGVFRGLVACGWIHGLFGGSLVALATWHGTRKVPGAIILQSRLELGPLGSWWRVRLPLAFPWLGTAMLATATLAATEMTVVDLYGYRTLADRFYLQYVVDPTANAILQTTAFPLLIAGMGMTSLFSRLSSSQSVQSSVESQSERVSANSEPSFSAVVWIAVCVAVLISALLVAIPILGIIVKAGHEVVVSGADRSVNWSASRFVQNVLSAPTTFHAEYRWTLALAGITGLVAVCGGWVLAACWRTKLRFRTTIDLLTIVMVLVPGPIVGLAVVRLFQFELPGFRTLYHQTLVPTVIGLLMRALPVAYWIIRAGYHNIGDEVLNAASLDATRWQRLWWIERPLLMRSLTAAFLAAAMVASGDVPVMLPVIPPGVTTVGTRLFEQLHSGARYQEAALAFWYVLGITLLAVVSCRLSLDRRARMP